MTWHVMRKVLSFNPRGPCAYGRRGSLSQLLEVGVQTCRENAAKCGILDHSGAVMSGSVVTSNDEFAKLKAIY